MENTRHDSRKKKSVERLMGIACVNLATFVWATNIVLGRFLKDSIGPITLSAARYIVASMIFAALLRQRPPEERRIGQDRWLLVAMAITGIVLFAPILYLGLRYTTAINSTLLFGVSPLLTAPFALWLLHEPMSRRQFIGAIMALIGVCILISGGSLTFWKTANFNKGDLIVLLAVAIWAIYSVIGSKVMRHRSSLSATTLSTYLGCPVLCIISLWELHRIPVDLNPAVILLILYIGVVPAAVGFYAWNLGIARLGPSNAMVVYNMLPVYGALLGCVFLGEPLGIPHIIGGMLIVLGGVWAAYKPSPAPSPAIKGRES